MRVSGEPARVVVASRRASRAAGSCRRRRSATSTMPGSLPAASCGRTRASGLRFALLHVLLQVALPQHGAGHGVAQPGAHARLAEPVDAGVLDFDPAEPRFEHLEAHDAGLDRLLRDRDRDGEEAVRLVALLERVARLLDVGERLVRARNGASSCSTCDGVSSVLPVTSKRSIGKSGPSGSAGAAARCPPRRAGRGCRRGRSRPARSDARPTRRSRRPRRATRQQRNCASGRNEQQ